MLYYPFVPRLSNKYNYFLYKICIYAFYFVPFTHHHDCISLLTLDFDIEFLRLSCSNFIFSCTPVQSTVRGTSRLYREICWTRAKYFLPILCPGESANSWEGLGNAAKFQWVIFNNGRFRLNHHVFGNIYSYREKEKKKVSDHVIA